MALPLKVGPSQEAAGTSSPSETGTSLRRESIGVAAGLFGISLFLAAN